MAGLDETIEKEENETEKVVELPKRKLFAYWNVNGADHKLKLSAAMICKLEDKYKTNLINLIASDGLPPLSVMLTILQGALVTWEHGVKYADVQLMYDEYTKEGGSQVSLMTDVLMPMMAVSGFFTENQTEELTRKMKESEEMM